MHKLLAALWSTKSARIIIGFGVIFGGYGVVSSYYRRLGLMVPDESYFTLAARHVFEGKLPYRDFAYTQMPFVPYINGVMLRFLGFGLDAHRLVSSIWGGLGMLPIILALRARLGRWEPAFLAVITFAITPRWCFLQAMGSWCGVTGLFVNIALSAVLWPGSLSRRSILFALAGTISIGCRLSTAPIIAVLALALLTEAPTRTYRLKILGGCLVTGALGILPFVAAAPQKFYFMNWQYHLENQLKRPISVKAAQAWDVSPAAAVIIGISLLAIPILFRQRKWSELLLLLAGLIAMITPLIPQGAWGVYVSPSVPIAATAGILALFGSGVIDGNPLRRVFWILPLLSLLHMTPLEMREGTSTEIMEIAAFIDAEVEEGPLLTPATIIAVEANREVLAGTTMGKFSAMHPWEQKRAARFLMTTLPDLITAVDEQEPAAIILLIEPAGWRLWNFRWALPSWDEQPEQYVEEFQNMIEECYQSAWRTSTMEVFVRKAQ